MNRDWPTKEKDITIAKQIMEEYATSQNTDSLGLFELVVNLEEKRMDFHLCSWVIALATHFKTLYGASQGDFVTRQVITRCITDGQTIH